MTLPGTDSFRATTCAHEKGSTAALNPYSPPIVLYTVAQSDTPRGITKPSKTKGSSCESIWQLVKGSGGITGPWGRRCGCRATSRRRSCDPRSCDRAGRPWLLVRLLPRPNAAASSRVLLRFALVLSASGVWTPCDSSSGRGAYIGGGDCFACASAALLASRGLQISLEGFFFLRTCSVVPWVGTTVWFGRRGSWDSQRPRVLLLYPKLVREGSCCSHVSFFFFQGVQIRRWTCSHL